VRSLVLIILAGCAGGAGGGSPIPISSPTAPAASACSGDCERRCEAHEIAACTRAAELFFDGKNGHPLDMAKSLRFAVRACEACDALGCMFVGYHYQDGLGTAWDPARAIATYEKACKGGAGTGCYNLATMYEGGHGVDVDLARADAYKHQAAVAWEAACYGREPRWCTNAAFSKAGNGEPSDATKQAMRALDRRACDAKVLVGCVEATRLDMELGTLSPAAGVTDLARLCTAGEPSGCTAAGLTLVTSDHPDIPRGVALLLHGCEAGDSRACHSLGLAYQFGEAQLAKDDAAALRYLEMACDRADRRACAAIAEIHGDHGDLAQVVAFSRRACQMGHAESCGVLGAAYRGGKGVEPNEVEGLRWIREACRGGFGPGCNILVDLDLELPIPAKFRPDIYRKACERGVATACTRLHAQ
jgi:TPR repeat protein